MYQFYYADTKKEQPRGEFRDDVKNYFNVTAIRPTMWEEHCLECSAPLCFNNCVHYIARSDGRCMRFENGISVCDDPRGCARQVAHVKFRKWANMMTIIYPDWLTVEDYAKLTKKNQKNGDRLKKLADSSLPRKLRWEGIRTVEWLRRRGLRKGTQEGADLTPDAFVFHGYSHEEQPFKLIIEIFADHTSVFRTSITLDKGENLTIIDKKDLSAECAKANNLVKIYPENDVEAELDILWCDFVKGAPVASPASEKPAATVKCVVWDLDNTLWDGTLIETDNPETLKLKDNVAATIKALDERGIIQSIASKNDFDPAWEVVKSLGLEEFFLYPQIHWNAKSGSLEQIAKSLNIGIDALALIDDSVFEREQVRSVWPQVRAYDAIEIPEILAKPEFDVMVTDESRNRRAMYRAEEKRNAIKAEGNNDTVDFLKKCHLTINIFEPATEDELARCYELVVRTNQLNMSGKKYTEDEFKEVLARNGHKNFAFSCKDDFGEYGIVGFGQYSVEQRDGANTLVFSEFAMSCRVAGKFVESALFKALLEANDCERGSFTIIKTKKNVLLRNTLGEIGFEELSDDNKTTEYKFALPLKHDDLVTREN